LCLMNLTNS